MTRKSDVLYSSLYGLPLVLNTVLSLHDDDFIKISRNFNWQYVRGPKSARYSRYQIEYQRSSNWPPISKVLDTHTPRIKSHIVVSSTRAPRAGTLPHWARRGLSPQCLLKAPQENDVSSCISLRLNHQPSASWYRHPFKMTLSRNIRGRKDIESTRTSLPRKPSYSDDDVSVLWLCSNP